jgi:processive 1,2-diacylglycerol beta-glucosyltransferase
MSATRPTILILTTHTGGGHLNLAQALKDLLETHYEVTIVNAQPPISELIYSSVSRHFLRYLAWQFTSTDSELSSLWLHRVLTLLSLGRLLSIIERVRPQLIITTHAFLSYATARAIERLQKRIPLVFQLTDLERLHMTWFTEKHADAYLAPTREIFVQAREQGIDENRLYLTGRPVRRQFLEAPQCERNATLALLEFDPAILTIFLQGGAKGSAGIDQTVESLLSAGESVQIILAIGNNKRVASRYANIKRVRVLPFTELIAPYMDAADIIAGKAGASFISEAFMLEKPFLVTAFIPGQETPNLRFIERHNLGWICLETTAQRELVASIASNPALIVAKVNDIRTYKAWNRRANQDICSIVDRLLC